MPKEGWKSEPQGDADAARPRIGIYGGTFDPPHWGHWDVATQALDQLKLDRLHMLPAPVPPHKQHRVYASAEERLAMLEALVAEDPRLIADDLELRREGPSYTVDTVREFQRRYPDAQCFLLIGADWAPHFSGWRESEEILQRATVTFVSRPGYPLPRVPPPGSRSLILATRNLSSTQIREALRRGDSVEDSIPPGVRAVIQTNGLYS